MPQCVIDITHACEYALPMNKEEHDINEEIERELEEEFLANQAKEAVATPEGTAPPTVEEELIKWRDVALRTAAEYDNYRKRMIKEKEDIVRYANQRLIEELLPVMDNFEMGMTAASADTQSMIYIGMNMVKKQLDDFLASVGVTPISVAVGDAYDVHKHEAIQSEASDQPEGTILRIVRRGYMLKDRLLRPVNVVVAIAPTIPAE